VIDEGHLATRESPATALLWEVVKEARHANLGTTIVTQDYKDVVSSDFGEPLLTNCATVVLLRQEPKQVSHLAEAFGLSQGEERLLRSAVPGKILGDGRVIPAEALLIAGDERCRIRVVSTELERRLVLGTP
jgi:type IV secretory pathway VirB4 component